MLPTQFEIDGTGKRETTGAEEGANPGADSGSESRPAAGNAPGAIELEEGSNLVLGRAQASDVRFSHAQVSRRHAELYSVGGISWVRDLGSANGTYVDGEIVDTAPLLPGSVVRLGGSGPTLTVLPSGKALEDEGDEGVSSPDRTTLLDGLP